MQIKRVFLIFAFVAVTIFGLMYGISPRWYAATFLGITDLNVNIAHILRALAGLYLALAAFWLCAAYHDKYKDAAILNCDPVRGRPRGGPVRKLDHRWSTRLYADDLSGGGSCGRSDRLLGLQATRAMTTVRIAFSVETAGTSLTKGEAKIT